jgi:hypothetical protein
VGTPSHTAHEAMSGSAGGRAARRIAEESAPIYWINVHIAGLVSLALAGIAVYFFHAKLFYAFGLAAFVTWLAWRSERRQRTFRYFDYLAEELETSLKDHISKELRGVEDRLNDSRNKVDAVR